MPAIRKWLQWEVLKCLVKVSKRVQNLNRINALGGGSAASSFIYEQVKLQDLSIFSWKISNINFNDNFEIKANSLALSSFVPIL